MPVITSVTCPVCGSLCDDIELVIEDNVVTKVKNGCALCEAKFLNYSNHRPSAPMIRKGGKLIEASMDDAVRRSAEILANASYPILYGWSSTSCEAIQVGLELAEEVGGVIDNTSTVCHGPSILSIQDVGMSSTTLGQLRHRADLVIYWGSNPWSSHPRHIERYTTLSEGRFQPSSWRRYLMHTDRYRAKKRLKRAAEMVPGGKDIRPTEPDFIYSLHREDRKLIVVDVRRTRTAEIADYFIQIKPNTDYDLLQAFRMLVRDEEIEVDEVSGVSVEALEQVAEAMVGCRLGILFFGLGLTMTEGKLRNVDAALSLVRDLNQRTKFLIMPMRGHFNVTGTNVVFTWQTGYPYAVDFAHGYPRYNPGETSVIDILCNGESDAALVIASDPVSHFPKEAVKNLVANPLVVIDPQVTPTSLMADVVIPSTLVGIEAEGTAYRMDRVPLPLKKVVEPPEGFVSDVEILQRLLGEVHSLRG
ncbi:MAG: molybdopterin-dependent oxidoreductase [Candidatus Bathyarchaeia archaeon]